jgi:hypothetical protein
LVIVRSLAGLWMPSVMLGLWGVVYDFTRFSPWKRCLGFEI